MTRFTVESLQQHVDALELALETLQRYKAGTVSMTNYACR